MPFRPYRHRQIATAVAVSLQLWQRLFRARVQGLLHLGFRQLWQRCFLLSTHDHQILKQAMLHALAGTACAVIWFSNVQKQAAAEQTLLRRAYPA